MAGRPGTFITLDDTDPVEQRQLAKLRNQDYASAGLVDAGPEKFSVDSRKGPEGRWCRPCVRSYHSWTKICPKCNGETIPESELNLPRMTEYVP